MQKDDDRVNKANELTLANVGGVFVVLLAGMGLACLIAVFEFIWKSRRMASNQDNVSPRPVSRFANRTFPSGKPLLCNLELKMYIWFLGFIYSERCKIRFA